jgi:hypothetical protein
MPTLRLITSPPKTITQSRFYSNNPTIKIPELSLTIQMKCKFIKKKKKNPQLSLNNSRCQLEKYYTTPFTQADLFIVNKILILQSKDRTQDPNFSILIIQFNVKLSKSLKFYTNRLLFSNISNQDIICTFQSKINNTE